MGLNMGMGFGAGMGFGMGMGLKFQEKTIQLKIVTSHIPGVMD